jgi:hypothetical protein
MFTLPTTQTRAMRPTLVVAGVRKASCTGNLPNCDAANADTLQIRAIVCSVSDAEVLSGKGEID